MCVACAARRLLGPCFETGQAVKHLTVKLLTETSASPLVIAWDELSSVSLARFDFSNFVVVEPSFQSSFQFPLTVLLRYQSLISYAAFDDNYHLFNLHFEGGRLNDSEPDITSSQYETGVSPSLHTRFIVFAYWSWFVGYRCKRNKASLHLIYSLSFPPFTRRYWGLLLKFLLLHLLICLNSVGNFYEHQEITWSDVFIRYEANKSLNISYESIAAAYRRLEATNRCWSHIIWLSV